MSVFNNGYAISLTEEERHFGLEHPVLKLGADSSWAPMDFINEKGKADGFDADLIALLNDSIDIFEIQIVSGEWDAIQQRVKAGELDGLIGINSTPQRKEYLNFTSSYLQGATVVVTRSGLPVIDSYAELASKRLALKRGNSDTKVFVAQHQPQSVEYYDTTLETLEAVIVGSHDYTIGSLAEISYLIKSNLLSNLKIAFSSRYHSYHIAVQKDLPHALTVIQKALDAIPDSELETLKIKWINFESTPTLQMTQLSEAESDWLQKNPVLRLGYDIDWPPIEHWIEQQGYIGLSADYMERIAQLLQVRIEPIAPRDWQATLDVARAGELELMSAVVRTAQRDAFLDFTEPYLRFPMVIVTRKNVTYISDMSALHGRNVGVVDGYASHDLLSSNHPDITLVPATDVRQGLLSVVHGETFAFADSLATVTRIIAREGIDDLKISGETPYPYELRIGIRKDEPLLRSAIQKALNAISEAERNEIYRKWVSVTLEHRVDYTLVWQILGAGAVLLAIFIYWNRRLAYEAKRRQQAEAAAQLAKVAAENANQAKSAFLANMSHELRTPLNAILGFAQILEYDPILEGKQEQLEQLQSIYNGGEHLLMLINDILDLAKVEAGQIELFSEQVMVSKFFDEVKMMFLARAKEKGIVFAYQPAAQLPTHIHTDPTRLRQVVVNLLGNAVKFTQQGQVSLKVSFVDGCLHIQVEDTGPGIAPEQHDAIFKPFAQTGDKQQKLQGTGLGLSITLKIVELMGGQIKLDSQLGKGSCFQIQIPMQAVFATSTEIQQTTRGNISGYHQTNGFNAPLQILIVDDIADNRSVLQHMLNPLGFATQAVDSGETCLQLVETWQPHLVLMDLRLADELDGFATTQRLHTLPGLESLPVIAVSANAYLETKQRAAEAGCIDFVTQPVERTLLLQALEKHLALKWDYA